MPERQTTSLSLHFFVCKARYGSYFLGFNLSCLYVQTPTCWLAVKALLIQSTGERTTCRINWSEKRKNIRQYNGNISLLPKLFQTPSH